MASRTFCYSYRNRRKLSQVRRLRISLMFSVPPGVQNVFNRLEKLDLLKLNDYRDAFINFGVTWEKLTDFNEQYLMRFLVEDIKMNTLDASKVIKAVKGFDNVKLNTDSDSE